MTEVLQSPSHFPSPSSSSPSCVVNDGSNNQHTLINSNSSNSASSIVAVEDRAQEEIEEERKERDGEGDQLSLLTLLVAVFRKSLIGCTISGSKELCAMEIGLPTNVRHVAHVTFDRFNGFLGLPVEFEPEVPRRAPSASANVFGVSTESMQLSFDARGNSVPTILLLMQRHLYAQGGLQVEGIFRLTADNSQEEFVRDQLNRGVVPDNVDVHCLAGLIKAWFRELPTGVLDSLTPEQVMQSQSEEECTQLVRLLPPTEAALLDWAVNLMADVAQLEHLNRMNARNVAMVFAPNMTQMADPLTALMYAVQVMNFLKTLIVKTLREREDSVIETSPASHVEPSDEDGHQSSSQPVVKEVDERTEEEEQLETHSPPTEDDSTTGNRSVNFLSSIENIIPGGNCCVVDSCPWDALPQVDTTLSSGVVEDDGLSCPFDGGVQRGISKNRAGQSSNRNVKKGGSKKVKEQLTVKTTGPLSIVGLLNSRTELAEAWR